jgi:hypothetical protein
LSGLALVTLAVGTVTSLVPFWKSATLSPDAIKRRCYWTGSVATVVLIFLSAWPGWQEGLFVAISMGLCLVAIAFRYTGHIKIRGRIYGLPQYRGPDRPPALARDRNQRPEQ